MQQEILSKAVSALLKLPPAHPPLKVEPFVAGGNNRVFAVTVDGRRYAVKVYFRHPADRRDRLLAEYAFLEYAARAGIRCVPGIVARDAEHGIGVYEFLNGTKLSADDVRAEHVDQAAQFFLDLNQPAARPHSTALSNASEACFSIDAHFAMVDGRIARLEGISQEDAVDRDAREFARVLAGCWSDTKRRIFEEAKDAGIAASAEIADRCISPSDFGFHNALLTGDRELCFIDFEYAGWDDPAKLIGDFFSHPAVPVNSKHLERFMARAFQFSAHPDALKTRARILFPVFQTKWCCIMLNEFLAESAQRRQFADPQRDPATRKREQLAKAAELFERIKV